MAKNIENLKRVQRWLEEGAPHATFAMEDGVTTNAEFENEMDLSISTLREERGQASESKADCGTVCCIAGAAYLMSKAPDGQVFPSFKEQAKLMSDGSYHHWGEVRDAALKFLGLTMSRNLKTGHYGHALFSTAEAPDNCTPAQAAAAVQRVIEGKRPWPKGDRASEEAQA